MTTDSLTSSTLSTVRSASQVLVADAGSLTVSNPLRPSSLDRQDAPPALPSAPSMKRNTTLPRQESVGAGGERATSLPGATPALERVPEGDDIIITDLTATDHGDHGPSPGAASLDPSAADAVKPASHHKKPRRQASEIRRTGIIIELHLWRADLLSSLLEVQPSGKICNANINKLCPPGLVLGCSSDSLVTRNVSSLLHHNGQLADLFNEPQEASVRGLLRKNTRNDKQVGPVHVLRTTHLGDATELEVAVQIIRRAPPSRNFYVLMHPHSPSCGRPDFRAWLEQMDQVVGLVTGIAAS
ncbi:tiny macrocysts protein B [Haematococcus lacustris]|uniref:Tiny macrocysts protein B n=1 Tax=Haematococcus lacustris TaxID=44745 RepID=A0A699ZMV3_HAELA|nr:tiny macrocysts protein B [Haematococcus lacustris]